MRVVITGATGNCGTALIRALADDPRVDQIVGVARRAPELRLPKTIWRACDVGVDDLTWIMRGADAVVHLAWLIQPSHDDGALWRTNVLGSDRVFTAAVQAGARTLIHASSVGVYSRGPKDRAVDEDWPREGVPSSFYARHKALTEHRLDEIERDAPDMRVVRIRPGLVFARRAASDVRRLFAGHLMPRRLVRPGTLPVVPDIPGLRFQAVHSDDLAAAYRAALLADVAGAFNVAAEPVLEPALIATALGARRVPMPVPVARSLVALTWRMRLQPTPAGWLDLALGVPVMSTSRIRRELGWTPRYTGVEALRELLEGIADGAGAATPPLAPAA